MDRYMLRNGLSRRTLLKGVGTLAGAVGLTAIAAACGNTASPLGGGGGTKTKGGTLTYGNAGEIVSPDPITSGGDSVSVAAVNMIHEGLVSYTPDLEIKPRLATSWEAKDTVWT